MSEHPKQLGYEGPTSKRLRKGCLHFEKSLTCMSQFLLKVIIDFSAAWMQDETLRNQAEGSW